jgi:TolB-like protein/DNA-binding winged helix-turn-helix (wHTH) protein/Flp pilus assembly protein TadD
MTSTTAPGSPTLRIGAWRVDCAVDEISRDGNSVKLERRAMQLLVCLAQHAGQVVSVEELLDQVWTGVVVTPDSVYHAVASLRKTLGDDAREPEYIATVPRRGYRLVAPVSPWTDVASAAGAAAAAARAGGGVSAPALRVGFGQPRLAGVLVVAVLALLGCLLVARLWLTKPAASTPAPAATTTLNDKSIAVLPFVDLSAKHDQEYFSDGLSEEIIDHLSRVQDLKVIARTSSFQFKGKSDDVRTIGRQLGVSNLLEGSVRTSGDSFRVTAQLIRVADGSNRWSQSYDAQMGDIFKIQDAIATSVSNSLGGAMTLPGAAGRARTPNIEAYNAFLRGKYLIQRFTEADSELAVDAFREAIRLDPTYATAWARLADAYNAQGVAGWTPPHDAYAAARAAVDRALGLDPNLAIAHQVLSDLEWNYLFDWNEALAEERKALALDPAIADYTGNNVAAAEAQWAGHNEEAVADFKKSIERDPLDASLQVQLGIALWYAQQLEDAENVTRKLLELQPGAAFAHALLAEILLAKRQSVAALAEAQKESDESARLASLSDVLWTLGRRAESEIALGELKAKYAGTAALSIAESYAHRQDSDGAFTWLNRAVDNREPGVTGVRGDGCLRRLHGDPRWSALLHKMNLPV